MDEYERQRRLVRAVKVLSETAEGRVVLDWLCELVDYGGTAFVKGDAYATHFCLGKQDPVNRLMHMVHTPVDTLMAGLDAQQQADEKRRDGMDSFWRPEEPAAGSNGIDDDLYGKD